MSVELNLTAQGLESGGFRVLHAGDDYGLRLTVTRGGGALNLTGAKVWLTVKAGSVESDAAAKLQLSSADPSEIEVMDPAAGVVLVHFVAAQTANLEGLWRYDVQVRTAAAEIITVCRGVIEFLPNITRALV